GLIEGKAVKDISTVSGGEFHLKDQKDAPDLVFTKGEDGKWEKITINIFGTLLKPKDITVTGTFTFNNVKRSFSGKTGARTDLGKFELLQPGKITLAIDGKTAPAQAVGTKLSF